MYRKFSLCLTSYKCRSNYSNNVQAPQTRVIRNLVCQMSSLFDKAAATSEVKHTRYKYSIYAWGNTCKWENSGIPNNLLFLLSSGYHNTIQSPTKQSQQIIGSMWGTEYTWKPPKLKNMPSHHTGRGKKWKNYTMGKGGQQQDVLRKFTVMRNNHRDYLKPDHVADDDLESSDLFVWHMQSGHGKEYIESLGLLSSKPLESLWDRIFNICRLKLFHPILGLSNSNASFRLSGLIVFECPPYKYLRWPIRKWGKFPPWVVTKTSLWRQTV